jgi:hypothetical protein
MNSRNRIPFQLSAISALVLSATAVLAEGTAPEPEAAGSYVPLQVENRPLQSSQTDYAGTVQLGLGYTSEMRRAPR